MKQSQRSERCWRTREEEGSHLKEADDETDHTVAPQPSRVDLVHSSLTQERLDDENERLESWKSGDVGVDDLSS